MKFYALNSRHKAQPQNPMIWQDLVTGEALWQAQEEPVIERMILQQSGPAKES